MPQITGTPETRERDVAIARSVVYRWLSLGTRYPDDSLRQQLGSPEQRVHFMEACRVLDQSVASLLVPAAEAFLRCLLRSDPMTMEAAYSRTFGHIVRSHIPLYETEYGEAQALRGLHELGDIAGFYRAFGLEVARLAADRVDHAAVECAFLHVLCVKEAHAMMHHGVPQRDVCRDAQMRFLRDHLGWWMPSMARCVLDTRAGTVYAAWAHLALAFLADEHRRFSLPEASERLGLRSTELSLEAGCQSCSVETACPGGTDAVALRSAAD